MPGVALSEELNAGRSQAAEGHGWHKDNVADPILQVGRPIEVEYVGLDLGEVRKDRSLDLQSVCSNDEVEDGVAIKPYGVVLEGV